MSEANRYDTEVWLGAALTDAARLEDEAGAFLDLTGCMATWHVYAGSPESPGAVALEVSTANGRLTVPDQSDPDLKGLIRRTVDAADVAAALAPGDYWQQLWVTDSLGRPSRVLWGYVPVRATEG